MMGTIANTLLRRRVALIVVLGAAAIIFASVLQEITGYTLAEQGLFRPEGQGRRFLSNYYGSWQMLNRDIRKNAGVQKKSEANIHKAKDNLKDVTEEFKVEARRIRNENIESGLKVSQEYEDEIRSLRRKFNSDEEHTSNLLHEFYDHKKLFDSNFDAAKEAHDNEREKVVGEIEDRLNKSHQEVEEAESKLEADKAKYASMLKTKKLGRHAVQTAYRKERTRRTAVKRAARIKKRQVERKKALIAARRGGGETSGVHSKLGQPVESC